MARKKTWREKLADDKGLPRIKKTSESMARRTGAETMVVPAPKEVDRMMRRVRKGGVTTIAAIRAALAKKHEVDLCCPMTVGIFAWIAAHAAEEDAAEGRKRITPWWRTLKTGGFLNPKYPGGVDLQRKRLEAEGHTVVRKGDKHLVADYESRLADL